MSSEDEACVGFAVAGKTGQIKINRNGDRQRNMTIWAFEPNATAYSPYVNDDLALATTTEPCNTHSLDNPNSGCVGGQVVLENHEWTQLTQL